MEVEQKILATSAKLLNKCNWTRFFDLMISFPNSLDQLHSHEFCQEYIISISTRPIDPL